MSKISSRMERYLKQERYDMKSFHDRELERNNLKSPTKHAKDKLLR